MNDFNKHLETAKNRRQEALDKLRALQSMYSVDYYVYWLEQYNIRCKNVDAILEAQLLDLQKNKSIELAKHLRKLIKDHDSSEYFEIATDTLSAYLDLYEDGQD